MRISVTAVRLAALAPVVILASACLGGAGDTETPAPTPTPVPTRAPEQTATEGPETSQAPVAASDALGDLVDEEDVPVQAPAYLDVVSVRAEVVSDELVITIQLAGTVPIVAASLEEITYLVMIDTDGPEEFDYWLTMENRADGEFAAVLTDWAANYSFDTDSGDYPGARVVEGETLFWRLPLEAVGTPASIRLSVQTQQFVGAVIAKDFVPDASSQLSAAPEGWIVVLPTP